MTYVDGIVLAVLAVSALVGLVRGLVREVLGLAAWVLAAWGAIRFYPLLAPTTHGWFGDSNVSDVVAYGIGFVGLLIVLSIVANLVAGFVQVSALGSLDRTLGVLFGLLRGAVVLVAAYMLAGLVIPAEEWPVAVQHARSAPFVYDGAVWAAGRLPPDYRPRLVAPQTRSTTADELLQANPPGREAGSAPASVRD